MIRDREHKGDVEAVAHKPAHDAGQDAHALAMKCGGDPAKLSELVGKLPAAQQQQVLAEAQKLYGNTFVQTVMKDLGAGYTPVDPTKGAHSRDADPGGTTTPANPTGQTPAQRAAANQLAGGGQGALAHPKDFDRSAELASLINGQPQKDGGTQTAPGGKDPTTLLGDAGKLPGPGDFRNATSKTGNESEEPAAATVRNPETGTKDPAAPAKEYPLTWENLSVGRVWAQFTHWLGDDAKFKNPDDAHRTFQGGAHRGMPDPTSDGAVGQRVPGGLGEAKQPTIPELAAAHQRQVTLPSEGAAHGPRMHGDIKEGFVESQRRSQDGRIDPVNGDGTTETLGGATSGSTTRPAGSGIEQVDGTVPGSRPGKHPDEG